MKLLACSAAVALLLGIGIAQEQPKGQAGKDAQKSDAQKQATPKSDTAGQSTAALPEMQTQGYKGTLVDASCAGGGSSAASSTAGAEGKKGDASRSGADQGCSVSSSTSQFALKTEDGKTLKFDSVGNMRAQEAVKMKKKWTDAISAGKPIRAKVTGVMNNDKLTVTSVN